MTRPDWDTYFLQIAQAVALRGDCRRSRVGAVIVDKSNVVVATGYNGVAPGQDGCLAGSCPRGLAGYSEIPPGSDYSNCIGIHAEDNAVRFARLAGQHSRLVGATVYVTREACDGCFRLLRDAGIARI